MGGGGVAGAAAVQDQDLAAGAGEDQCGRQAGCASTDHHDVVAAHVRKSARTASQRQRTLPILGNAAAMGAVYEPTDAISAALDRVGSRLRQIRTQRAITLVELSERTGISKSTLSRLENGQRRASLGLLPPLAQAYRVPLDDLVGAPDVGDPRIRLGRSR